MPASVRDQLTVCGSLADLEKYIAKEQVPKEYGGRSPFALGEAEEEKALRQLVEENNAKADGVGLDAVVGAGSRSSS